MRTTYPIANPSYRLIYIHFFMIVCFIFKFRVIRKFLKRFFLLKSQLGLSLLP